MIEAETISDVALGAAPERVQGPWREFWHAYAQSRGALLGLALTVTLVLLAIFAGVVAPHPPYEQYREFALTPPVSQSPRAKLPPWPKTRSAVVPLASGVSYSRTRLLAMSAT